MIRNLVYRSDAAAEPECIWPMAILQALSSLLAKQERCVLNHPKEFKERNKSNFGPVP
jgi:hypothetical protein